RLIERFPGSFKLHDISKDGRALITLTDWRGILMAGRLDGSEQELSWLDHSVIRDFSPDGKTILIHERGEGAEAPDGTMFIRNVDGSPGVRLSAGYPLFFSPDGRQVVGYSGKAFLLVPVGAGSVRSAEHMVCEDQGITGFQPDGKHIYTSCLGKDGF